jgi:phosphoadenosine phosphosulfate reductase
MSVVDLPGTIDQAAINATEDVLDRDHDSDLTFALVSGGHDSLTAMHVALLSSTVDVDGIVHINTDIGIPDTRKFVQQRAEDLGLEYYEVGDDYRLRQETYWYQVREHGFPGPPLHTIHYRNLKEKPLQRFLNEFDEKITLISGVRQHESDRRMENVAATGIGEYLGYTTISPLVNWRGIDVTRYRAALYLPSNPVVDHLEMSGECLCGAYAKPRERRMIELFYPCMHRYLLCLEAKVSSEALIDNIEDEAYTTWGHGQYSDRTIEAKCDADQKLLCTSCENQCSDP